MMSKRHCQQHPSSGARHVVVKILSYSLCRIKTGKMFEQHTDQRALTMNAGTIVKESEHKEYSAYKMYTVFYSQ